MKYFLDTEFIEDGKTIDLISIGIVCEDGREYYAINENCNISKASDWVRTNVIDHIEPKIGYSADFWKPKEVIKQGILGFIGWDTGNPTWKKPEFWAYYGAYDWVAFCQIFGTMMDLPKGFPMYCKDIKQLCDDLGNPRLPKQESGKQNALADAKHNLIMYDYLMNLKELNLS